MKAYKILTTKILDIEKFNIELTKHINIGWLPYGDHKIMRGNQNSFISQALYIPDDVIPSNPQLLELEGDKCQQKVPPQS